MTTDFACGLLHCPHEGTRGIPTPVYTPQEIGAVAACAKDGIDGVRHDLGRLGRIVDEVTGVYIHAGKVTPLPMQRYNRWEIQVDRASGGAAVVD